MNIWLTIIGMALVTYAVRALPLFTMHGAPSALLERLMRYVPPSVFAALIVPALFLSSNQLQSGALLWAGLLGVLAAWFTHSIALTIVAGLAAFALLRALGVA
jgi:branched-subunit amino acid transport protein